MYTFKVTWTGDNGYPCSREVEGNHPDELWGQIWPKEFPPSDAEISLVEDRVNAIQIDDRVMTPCGEGTVVILEGASQIQVVWVNMDHADGGYHYMRFSNKDWDGLGLLTVNKYPVKDVEVL